MYQRRDNRKRRLLALAAVTLGGIALAASAYAFDGKPTLGIKIPTIKFTDIQVESKVAGGGTVDIPWMAEYISGIYRYSVGFGVIIGTVMIIIGGFQYLTAGGDASRVKAGKDRITDAVIGMLLVIGSYVILQTVNPDLVSLEALKIITAKRNTSLERAAPEVMASLQAKAKDTPKQLGGTPAAAPTEAELNTEKAKDAEDVTQPSEMPQGTGGGGKTPTVDVKPPPSVPIPSREDLIPYVRAVAKAYDVPYCIVHATIWQESRWQLDAIGHDENFFDASTLVRSRLRFLREGKRFSGSTLNSGMPAECDLKKGATKETRALCLKIHGSPKFRNDDKINASPPDFGLDWRFGHGIGLGQATLHKGDKCSNGDRGITYDSGPPYGARCYTPAVLVTVEGSVDATVRLLRAIYRQRKDPATIFGCYIGGCDPKSIQAQRRMPLYQNCVSSGLGK